MAFLRPLSIVSILLVAMACGLTGENFPADEDIIAQWEGEKSRLLALMDQCQMTKNQCNLPGRSPKEVRTGSIRLFDGCELALRTSTEEEGCQLGLLDRDDSGKTEFLSIVTHQHESLIGLRRLEPISEEKGLLYISQDNLSPLSAEFQAKFQLGAQTTVVDEALDPFVGDYTLTNSSGTKGDRKNNRCDLWMFRPIEPHWYLYYHQRRNCSRPT
jgi:hypothetical protein